MAIKNKISFSIPSSKPRPPNPATRPAAFSSSSAAGHSAPAPRFFVTTFDPFESLTPAPAPLVIPPLPNARNPTAGDGPLAFVLDASADASSSSLGYGLTVRSTNTAAAREPSGDLTLRRFKDDMATLPDVQGSDEYEEVLVEGFGAALLAGYGWKKGDPIGRDKSKRDAKVFQRGRRAGTHGLGADPSQETRSRRPLPAGKEDILSKKQRLEEPDSTVTRSSTIRP